MGLQAEMKNLKDEMMRMQDLYTQKIQSLEESNNQIKS